MNSRRISPWRGLLIRGRALMRIRGTASLLGPAGREAARPLMESVLATPRRVYIGASVAALVVGIGANALLLQIGRHPAPLLAPVTPLPASTDTAAPAGTVDPVAPHVSPTPISEYSTASAAAPLAAGKSRATQASAPDITSSIGPAAQDKQHQSSAPSGPRANDGPSRSRQNAASPTTDRVWCALPRSRSRSSDTRSSPTAPKTAPPGALFAILSARTGWPRQLKSARNS